MSKPKFKVGDRVTLVDPIPAAGIGDSGVVVEVLDDHKQIAVDFDNGHKSSGRWITRFIHEVVYNSRLYKALQDD